MRDSTIRWLTASVPVFIGGLYLLGMAFHQGSLSGAYLDDSLFPLERDKTLLNGWIALTLLGLQPSLYAALASTTFTALIVWAAIVSSTQGVRQVLDYMLDWLAQLREKVSFTVHPSTTLDRAAALSAPVTVYTVGWTVALVLLALSVHAAFKAGEKSTREDLDRFGKGRGKYALIYTTQETTPFKALPIICGTTHCAYWLGDRARVLPISAIIKSEHFLFTASPSK